MPCPICMWARLLDNGRRRRGVLSMITIVGLGPGDALCLTREAWDVREEAGEIWLRTSHHPTVAGLPAGPTIRSCDDLYQTAGGFEQVYEAIVDRVLGLGRRAGGVVYAVPGHPMVGEATVAQIVRRARDTGLETRIVDGLSFIEPTLAALGQDALPGLQVHDALELAARNHPPINPGLPAMVAQLYSRRVAAGCKLTLMNLYPDDHQVTLVSDAGGGNERLVRLPLYELDRRDDIAHLTTLYIPALDDMGSFEDLQDTVARLRAPGGCPWDREQTHRSLRRSLLEETYEVAEAIDEGDAGAL